MSLFESHLLVLAWLPMPPGNEPLLVGTDRAGSQRFQIPQP